jgi:hypothetical protein
VVPKYSLSRRDLRIGQNNFGTLVEFQTLLSNLGFGFTPAYRAQGMTDVRQRYLAIDLWLMGRRSQTLLTTTRE